MSKIHLKLNRFFVYSFILFIIIFLGLIINYYNDEKNNERRENREYIQTLAKIKSSEIKRWFNERLSDGAYLFSNFYLKENLPKLAASPNIKDSIKIAKVVETMFKNHDYKNIFIIDSDKKCLVCMNPDNLDNFIADSVNSALESESIKFSNFYRDQSGSQIDLDIYVPILSPGKSSSVIILKIDPSKIIFPTVKNWLINNSSGESFLVYREKDSVVFINTLKFNKSAPLTFKIPLTRLDIPAVKVALGFRGITEGIDYRGEKVLADLREIENTPWLLVSKIDLSEIYKPVSNRLSFILIFLFPLFAFAGLSFLYFQSRQNYKDLLKLNESNKKFEALYQTSNDSILIIENDKILNCNAKSEEIFKIDQSNIISKSLLDFSPEFQTDGSDSKEKFFAILQKVNEGEPQLFEWIFINNDNVTFCEINLSLLLIDNKKYIVAIVRDITGRKKAERDLYESEERYRSLFKNNHSVMLLLDPNSGQIIDANPAACSFYGYSLEEITRLKITDINQLTQEQVLEEMQRAKKEQRRQFFFRHKLSSNEIRDVEVFSGPISFHGNTLLYSIVHDITERKRAEEAVEDERKLLRTVIDLIPDFVYVKDPNSCFLLANDATAHGMGFLSPVRLIGSCDAQVYPENIAAEFRSDEERVLAGEILRNKEEIIDGLDGQRRVLLTTKVPLTNNKGEIVALVGIGHDITERKKTEEALKHSEIRYRSLFENMSEGFFQAEIIEDDAGQALDFLFIDVNSAHSKIMGLRREDVIGKKASELFPGLESTWIEAVAKVASTGIPMRVEGYIKAVGRYFVNSYFSPKPGQFASIFSDITDRIHAEEMIKKLSTGIEQSPASIVITDINGKIEYVNPKFTALTGYTFEEVNGKNPNILKSGKMTQEEYSVLWKTISSKKDWRGEFLNKKKNGELYWESALISPILNEHGEITNFIAIKEDITDAKNADEAFKKMTAELMQQNRNLEQFTYIMSHNLRTPVANIIGISDAMQHVNLDDNEKTLMMKGLFSSVKKLDEVILDLSNILQIKQGVNEKKEKVSFSKLVQDIRTSILTLIEAEHVEIKTDFTTIDEMITLKSYLYSIFYNLILNSIKYKRIDSNPLIEIKSFKNDGKLILTFKDNGIGIDLKKKGNEVFGMYKRFHTHTEGKGMGLFMTKMQTETLGGKIQIQSEVNKGTEFKIEFEL
ncbi:MAG: PAS domain S-box protein [Ignavibacteria bacterium]